MLDCGLDENQQLPEDGGLECLKAAKHRDIKSKHCKKLLFREEREEAEDAEVNIKMKSKPDAIGIC